MHREDLSKPIAELFQAFKMTIEASLNLIDQFSRIYCIGN